MRFRGRCSDNRDNRPRQYGGQWRAQDQGELGGDEQHCNNRQYRFRPNTSSSDAMDRCAEQPGTAAKHDRHDE